MNKIIYLDKAGTYGNIPKPILTSILSYLNGMCGNASSLYSIGNKALSEVNKATDLIKRTTNAKKYIIPVVVQKAIIGLLTIFAIVQLSQAQ